MHPEERRFYEGVFGPGVEIPDAVVKLHEDVAATKRRVVPGRLSVDTMAVIAYMGQQPQQREPASGRLPRQRAGNAKRPS